MSAVAHPWTVKTNGQDVPITGETGSRQDSDVAHAEDTMAPRRHGAEEDEGDFEMREAMHVLMLASTSMCKAMEAQATKAEPANGATNRRVTWLMAIFAMVTIMGAGANFLTSSGVWIGNREHDATQIKELKDEVGNLKTWNEKLRNNMAAYGWLIDSQGNVSRIEQQQQRRP